MKTPFKSLSDSQKKSFLKLISQSNPDHGLEEKHVKIMTCSLSFLPDYEYYECEDFSSVPNRFQYYLKKDKKVFPVQFSENPTIQNKLGDLTINENTVFDYLKFYYKFFVKGAYRLTIISHTDDVDWQDDLTPTVRQSLEKDLSFYPKIEKENNGYLIKIACVFKTSIVIISFFIDKDGFIEIQDRQSLVDDLPLKSLP